VKCITQFYTLFHYISTPKISNIKQEEIMSEKKVIAVVGATGAQGGGLVRAILNDPQSEFTPRAIVRDKNSDNAKELSLMGAELVQADLDDPESIKKAFKGAYGAFCVTFFWAHFSPEKEKEHAKVLTEAARDADLKHVIWSTLEDTRKWIPLEDDRMPTLQGKYKVPHFDAKGEADEYFRNTGIPVTYLVASFYWENMIYFGLGPKQTEDGKYSLAIPMGDKKLAGIAREDIGKAAYGIFKGGSKYFGEYVGVAGDHLTVYEMTEKMSGAMGKEIKYQPVSPETFRGFGFPGADDVGNMFQFYADAEEDALKLRNIEKTRLLNPEVKNFDDWLKEYKDKIPLG
jgi:uncharacterized protein YbjT (DUF2867 family)